MALTSCCCCVSLRTIGLILAVLEVIGDLYLFIDGIGAGAWASILQCAGVVIYCLCIYAIVKEKADLMLPALVLSIIDAIHMVIIEILLIMNYSALEKLNDDHKLSSQEEQDLSFVIPFCILYSIAAAFSFYFWCVLHALYKEFKGTNSNVV